MVNESVGELMEKVSKDSQGRADTMERLLSAADSAKVFGPPVVSGQSTVITAAEVAAGGGFGSGLGFGLQNMSKGRHPEENVEAGGTAGEEIPVGAGGGGGGGGGSMGRPVAVITVTPEGIRVKPVLDVTKISLTAMAALMSLAVLAIKMFRKR